MHARYSALAFLCLCMLPSLAIGQEHLILSRGQRAVVTSNPASTPEPRKAANSKPANLGFPSLAPRTQTSANSSDAETASSKVAGPAVTVTSSLAVVLGLFAGLVWLTRKYGSRTLGVGAIPKDVLQSLGSTQIDSRTRISMLRCGSRILVVSQTTNGMQTLAEVTDPEEVRELTAACLGDSKKMFANTLESIERERPDDGFAGTAAVDRPAHQQTPRERGRLFATA
ncbi:MAG: FliO/MopB family protein [Rubripirellula sp.]